MINSEQRQAGKLRVGVKTLGCKVNQYESEAIKENFKNCGHEIVDENDFADVYIINTCTVTNLADRKSRQYIRKMKRVNPLSIVTVTGCYAQVSPEEVAEIEGVDIVAGTNQKSRLVELIQEHRNQLESHQESLVEDYRHLTEYEETGVITSMESRTRAYIKIQEGCDRFCSYCVIPYARGPVRSRRAADIVKEAQSLLEQGFKELILTGINTALYGTETSFEQKEQLTGIEIILHALEELGGEFRVRLSSLEPTVIHADYVKRLLKYKRLCPHLHLSIQSGSDKILQAMNRRYDRSEYLEIVNVLKEFDPGYGVTTDMIVGFPGETEADFRESLEMVNQAGFCKVHAFKYSKRAGTKAADMREHVAPEVKNRRSQELIEAGAQAAEQFFKKNIGGQRTVLAEEYLEEAGCLTGYTENYIKTYIPCTKELGERSLNALIAVELTDLYRDGMAGRLAE
ncbi:tRNA (N(6)-L-threonylcarbamoyladenosine(37)-C(2))-methylthiotransferase MtaB [Aminipila butyrica]|uniref:Threonylcarbamoyladenosine tRNA methylthiotransferase MtaB n=1 Tax=Aminipila butyrica TaxID=433296 RepID=A0A858BWZ8_9FIRM|nr:tRNA (N(6)-L-threonylcarbamoyladenosine(37)-C(2))-methylthiotransferase MtaB [Aminipila butyrica]QIB69244.1 tRNA (N(6)-L-threonylcarbamoyladenosine(37)-C(2))-methylthiotransferase MtaB [Aminipila butyrica]